MNTNHQKHQKRKKEKPTLGHVTIKFLKISNKEENLKNRLEKKNTHCIWRNKDKNDRELPIRNNPEFYTQKNIIQKEGKREDFSGIQKLKEFTTSRFALQEMLKESFT